MVGGCSASVACDTRQWLDVMMLGLVCALPNLTAGGTHLRAGTGTPDWCVRRHPRIRSDGYCAGTHGVRPWGWNKCYAGGSAQSVRRVVFHPSGNAKSGRGDSAAICAASAHSLVSGAPGRVDCDSWRGSNHVRAHRSLYCCTVCIWHRTQTGGCQLTGTNVVRPRTIHILMPQIGCWHLNFSRFPKFKNPNASGRKSNNIYLR